MKVTRRRTINENGELSGPVFEIDVGNLSPTALQKALQDMKDLFEAKKEDK